ncbi:MAG TPA: asparagine synthetase B, partial [Gemmatimonadaceae bacterium]|nr:asparagine synthetase B [Gemmatimonadaceae bacterium]
MRGTRELEELARRLTTPMTHRGPDGTGGWCGAGDAAGNGWVALGHRRLAIIDLATGAQPMSSEDARIVVSFNGEIYNHRELRVELERRGCRFRTSSDTEVLIHGWREWGISLLERLNGIFAFALADATQRRVLLARDPAGVKPLYVGVGAGLTWFASELSAARAAGLSRMAADPDALKLYLTFGFVPSPFAAHPDSWKVPPSHYAFVTPDAAGQPPEFFAYSTKVRSTHAPRGRAQWRDALANELDSAIRRQMLSDVPVGTLLSGGVDSSVVTASMAATGAPPQAFAIGFSDGGVNEADAARRAAGELRVPVDVVETTRAEYLEGWNEALAQLSEPVANPGLRLVDLLCRHV